MHKKEKVNNLNIMRGFLTLYVVLFHTRINVGCDFGKLNEIFNLINPFITAFFVLSGFVLYYNYYEIQFSSFKVVADFLKKRILNIYPIYALLWIVYFYYQMGATTVYDDIITFTMQFFALFGINYYNYLINTGIWFFSCILVCYLFFPYICLIVKTVDNKQLIAFAVIIYVLNSTMPFKIQGCYYSAFCRLLEFSAGMITARVYLEKKIAVSKGILLILIITALAGNILLIKLNPFSLAWNQERINFFSLPAACALAFCFSSCSAKLADKISKFKPVKFFSDYSLECYAGALPAMVIFAEFISKYNPKNIWIFIIVFSLNILFAVLLKKYTKCAKKFIGKFGFCKSAVLFAGIMLISIAIKPWLV